MVCVVCGWGLVLVLSRRSIHIDPGLETVPGSLTTFLHKRINNTPLVASIFQDQKYLQGYTALNVATLFIALLSFPLRANCLIILFLFLSSIVEPFWEGNFLWGLKGNYFKPD